MASREEDAFEAIQGDQDAVMLDENQLFEGDGDDDDEEPLVVTEEKSYEQLRVKTLPGAEPGSASFQITEEDHTLGNALRYIIMKNPQVEFCGYSIPHPSEAKMNIRIQIYPEYEKVIKPFEVLMKGLDDLADLCDHVKESFQGARNDFGKYENEVF